MVAWAHVNTWCTTLGSPAISCLAKKSALLT
jgi:hypothetical protein